MKTVVNNVEMSAEEIENWHQMTSGVKDVEKIERLSVVREPETLEAIAEGLLYVVGDEGVRKQQLAEVLNCTLEDVDFILKNIQQKYSSSVYGVELVGYGQVYKFITKKSIYKYVQQLFNVSSRQALSQSAMETLAIIAYKQPVTRVEIEELRGVGVEMMLKKLMARNLIKEAGRSEAPGRPILYEVTDEFMDSFKLYDLKDLPELPDFGKGGEGSSLFD